MRFISSNALSIIYNHEIIGSVYINLMSSYSLFLEKLYTWNFSEYPRKKILEVSDICLSKSYVNEDILICLFRYLVRYAINSNKEFIAFLGDSSSESLYKKIGAIKLDNQPLDFLTHVDESIYFIDLKKVMIAIDIDTIYWSLIYKPLLCYLDKGKWKKDFNNNKLLLLFKSFLGYFYFHRKYRVFYPKKIL